MKYIEKGPEPEPFTEWKALSNDDWQPTYDVMGSSLKNSVKERLMKDQGFLCCYCERRLTAEDSHIEHFAPQSDILVDPLDYANLLCSCQKQLKKGEPRHCGNLKEDWFDADLLISPLDPGCENRFTFTADGGIRSVESGDDGAKKSIKMLGLGIPKLNDMRKKAIEPFIEETLDEQELKHFVTGYLDKDSQGVFGEFYMAIKCLFGEYTYL
jgi:uncharacterized protein (TIGR02646 family)